jgi:RNA polymerase sigma factor (sigma-70 family)
MIMSAPMREATHVYRGNREDLRQPLQTLFGVGSLAGLTDEQLLERFADGRGEASEAAFAALVDRHGPMVLHVTRAVLGDRHDAEDAFQGTFLVLALRAGSIRRRDALASWLYGAARRVALRARRQAARHRERERRRAAQIAAFEPLSTAQAELCPELYDELDRLPEPFRAAVLLCDLEGHSYERAARVLHCPVGTVQSRLARGRQRLRQRLESRGLAPTVVFAGTKAALTARSAVSPHLAMAIAKTASGVASGRSIAAMVPKPIAGLVGPEIRTLLTSRALVILMTLVTSGLVAAAMIGLVIAGQRGDDPKPDPIAAISKAKTGPIHVHVVDVQGKGVPEISVELIGAEFDVPIRFRTNADGRVLIPRDADVDGTFLIAGRDRESLGWTPRFDAHSNQSVGTRADPLVMKLLPLTHRVEGSAVDRDGKPIAGVTIEPQILSNTTNGAMIFSLQRLAPRAGALLAAAVTDPAGKFVLMLPEETNVVLRTAHPRYIGRTQAQPESRVLEPIILEPAGAITGKVTDEATGRPVAGANIGAQLIEYRRRGQGGWGDALTDEKGRFVIGSLEPGVYNLLFQRARGRTQATARAVEGLRVRAGADTSVDLTLIDGRPLRGLVIDQETEQPVAGASVGCYGPATPQSGAAVESRRTDDAGRFTFYLPPGEQHVYIMDGSSFGHLSRRTVVLPDQGDIEPVRLVRTNPATARPVRDAMRVPSRPDARAEVKQPVDSGNDEPDAVTTIGPTKEAYVGKAQSTPKAMIKVKDRPAHPDIAVGEAKTKMPAPKMRTVTGRVHDPQGRPVPGVSLAIVSNDRLAETFDLASTDRDGVFVFSELPDRALQISLSRPGFQFQMEALAAGEDTAEWTYRMEADARSKRKGALTKDEPIAPGLRERLTFVDLARRGNDPLDEGPAGSGNDLNRLPRGLHKMGDAYFGIGETMVHTQGGARPDLPRAVKGIKVQAKGHRLHILHATQYGEDPGKIIGAYFVHYTDGSHERIPIVYGRNILNWWSFPSKTEDPTDARVAWTGASDTTEMNPGIKIRLFDLTWTNPHPDKQVAALDILSAGTACDPFLVAVTLERD